LTLKTRTNIVELGQKFGASLISHPYHLHSELNELLLILPLEQCNNTERLGGSSSMIEEELNIYTNYRR
jgi:hypothetical protein